MSEQVDLKQVREVANKPIAPLEQVWRDLVCKMADEIERLRSENEVMKQKLEAYITFVMAEGLQEEFLDWMECDISSTGGNNGNEWGT